MEKSEIIDSDTYVTSDESKSFLEKSTIEIIDESESLLIEDSDEVNESAQKTKSCESQIISDSDEDAEEMFSFAKTRNRINRLESSNESYEQDEQEEDKENNRHSINVSTNSQRLSRGSRVNNSYGLSENDSYKEAGIIEISDSDESRRQSENFEINEGDSSIDQMLNQIQKYNDDLKKSKFLYESANIEVLPDKGKKLRQSIRQIENEIMKLEHRIQVKLTSEDRKATATNVVNDSFSTYRIKPETLEDSPTRPMHDYQSGTIIKKEPKLEPRNSHDDIFLAKPTELTDIDNFGKKAQKTFETQQTLTMERLEILHGSIMSQPKETDLASDPRGLKVSLMDHQKYALSWLLWREQQNPSGGILADDMGLGKTLTMISLILKSKEMNQDEDSDSDDDDRTEFVKKLKNLKYRGGTLVVCPASLIQQWDSEIQNRCKRNLLDVSVFHGNNRETKARRVARLDVVITTYDTLVSEKKRESALFQIRWHRVILDEAHVIRNNKSLKCQAVCDLVAKKRWALTGTPIQNKESDLYSIMKFLKCSPFDDIRVWKRWVDNKNEAGTKRLATVLKSIMLRRTKQELQNLGKIESLPEKFIEVINVQLSKEERVVYQKLLLYSQTLFAQFLHQQAEKKHVNELYAGNYDAPTHFVKETQFNKAQKRLLQMHGSDVKSHEILVLLLRLRQVCCHPSLIQAMLDREDLETQDGLTESDGTDVDLLSQLVKMNLDEGNDNNDDLNESTGVDKAVEENVLTSDNPLFNPKMINSKLKTALDLICKVVEKNEKIVVISQWTSYLELLGNHLDEKSGCTYDMFTGAVAVKKRQSVIENFNKRNKHPKILLLSLTAGGVGLNLTGANNLLIMDIHWNPQLELQAHDRVYRFGQDKEVFVYRLLCKDTVEERVQQLQNKKLEIAGNVLEGKNISSKLTIDDLKMLFSV